MYYIVKYIRPLLFDNIMRFRLNYNYLRALLIFHGVIFRIWKHYTQDHDGTIGYDPVRLHRNPSYNDLFG